MNKRYTVWRMEHIVINFPFVRPCVKASQLNCV